MKRYIAGLMLGCDKARHGELSEGEMDDLAEECRGWNITRYSDGA